MITSISESELVAPIGSGPSLDALPSTGKAWSTLAAATSSCADGS